MPNRLKVVLSKSISKLGKEGDMVEVAPGYARNYLIPQGLGQFVTPGLLRQVEQRQEKERQRLIALKVEAQAQQKALETIGRFVIRKQVGEEEAIFGTVTTQEVADVIQESTKQEIDRRGITLPDINKTGFYKATVKLHPDVSAEVEIQVAPL